MAQAVHLGTALARGSEPHRLAFLPGDRHVLHFNPHGNCPAFPRQQESR